MNPNRIDRATEQGSYRCPGCGEMVDNNRLDEVLRHHRHVLDAQFPPAWFNARTGASQPATVERPSPTETSPRDPSTLLPEARVRRYGHSDS